MSRPRPRYLVVSPVKDEEKYIEATLRTVSGQTVRPDRWIIVDDGSTDRTPEILRRYAMSHDWIEVVTRVNQQGRQPGSAVMNAFFEGIARTDLSEFDYVVKLDCDVELPEDYFEQLLCRFDRDPRLGIASGTYLEESAVGWQAIAMPHYHAAGASKVIRRECFAEIGGFVRERGWDTVDEVRARVRGWRTQHFPELQFRHLKREGSGVGSLRTNVMHGDVYFLTGGGLLFLLVKAGHRMIVGTPPFVGGFAMLFGYFRSWWSGRERLVSPVEAEYYRRLLNHRLRRVLRLTRPQGEADFLES